MGPDVREGGGGGENAICGSIVRQRESSKTREQVDFVRDSGHL
jgi:hypothetical protein